MTATTNMNWTDPTVGASNDTWGDLANAIWDNLDSHVAGLIYGLTLSAAGSTATFGIAAGAASGMVLSSAYTKTTSSWGVGTGQGALDTGTIANTTWYHVWLIQRSDTGVVDVLVSTSATNPTMPSNYDRKRRIGAMKTDGSAQWIKFTQKGDEFLWDVPVGDYVGATSGASTALTLTLTVPTGVKIWALFNWSTQGGAGNGTNLVTSFDQADSEPSTSLNTQITAGASAVNSSALRIRTNTSAQVRARFINTDVTYYASTQGWYDPRGQY